MAEKDEKKDETLTPVGPGLEEETVVQVDDDDSDDNRSEADSEDEGSSEEGDERVGQSEDEDREAIRERRRQERKRHKEQRDRDRRELRFLRERNEMLERRFSQVETRQTATEQLNIDSRISAIESQIAEAESLHAQAIEAKKGEAATEALKIRDAFRDELAHLRGLKARSAAAARGPKQPEIDPEIRRRAVDWINDNSDWFDPQLRDEDSAVAKAIEDSMYREGRYNARTDAYWNEYNRRLKKRLPHLFQDRDSGRSDRDEHEDEDDDQGDRSRRGDSRQTSRRGGGPRLTTGGRERPLRQNEVYISPERKAAMVDAGVWDDPILRNRYLKRYQQYDREHKS